MVNYLTTVDEVKRQSDLTNEYSDEEIGSYITDVEYDIFMMYPNFKKYSEIKIDAKYDSTYYIQVRNSIYRPYKLSMVREEDSSLDSQWKEIDSGSWVLGFDTPTVTVPDSIQLGSDGVRYRIDWIPTIFNRLATLMTKQKLIERGIIFSNSSPEAGPTEQVSDEIDSLKAMLTGRRLFVRSSEYADYDPAEYVSYEQHNTE